MQLSYIKDLMHGDGGMPGSVGESYESTLTLVLTEARGSHLSSIAKQSGKQVDD